MTKAKGATTAGMPLSIAARLWPTATDASASARHGYMLTGHAGTTLTDAIRDWSESAWPTPTATDWKRAAVTIGATQADGQLTEAVASHLARTTPQDGAHGSPAVFLNPSFVEALMGFPIGWTVLPRSETLSFLW
jgi:hypothetical protein